MIITLKGANFSASNIGQLDSWFITRDFGLGVNYNGPASVKKNAALNVTITISSGYELNGSVSVTMGGSSITSGITTSGNTITISIAQVTGHVEIKVPTKSTSGGDEPGGNIGGRIVFADQNLIAGYVDRSGTVLAPEGRHKHFTMSAEGIDTITITPPMPGAVNSLYYLIHIANDNTITTYFNIKDGVTAGVAQTISLGGTATGTLYFNAFQDEPDGSYTYVKEAIITTVGGGNSGDNTGSTDGEVYVFATAANRTPGFIKSTGAIEQSNAHYYSSISAEDVQSISVTPTMKGPSNTLYYIVHVASNGTATPYVHLQESVGETKIINFNGTATGTIYFNEFTDSMHLGYEYVTQAVIKR